MKEYNAKIIVDNDNFVILFDCDKEMNNMCNKKNCDYCTYTTDSRYAKGITNKEAEEKMAEGKIEQYRNRIEQQNKIIDELYSKTIQSENVMLDTTDESIDEDLEEIITDTIYADGKVRKTIKEYKYKSDKEAE